jgi:biopolymer transport protein TolR
MAMSMAGGGPSAPQMNVTPLIDVLLVLIVMFLIMETMSRQTGLRTEVPQESKETATNVPEPLRTIVIQLQQGTASADPPRVKINSEEVEWPDLPERLRDIYKQRAEKVAFVQGDDEVEFRFVADVIDDAKAIGVERVGLMPREVAAK